MTDNCAYFSDISLLDLFRLERLLDVGLILHDVRNTYHQSFRRPYVQLFFGLLTVFFRLASRPENSLAGAYSSDLLS